MKLGKILKFSVVLKSWLKTDIFDHSEHAKDDFGKMQTFWVELKIGLKIDIFDH